MPQPSDDESVRKQTGTPEELLAIDAECERRSLILRTPRKGPLDLDEVLENHVQGITRVDQGDSAGVICSVSGSKQGMLWLARFDLEKDPLRPGQRRLAKVGTTVSTIATPTPHPGGIQASGDMLAVPSEADSGFARVDLYVVDDLAMPMLVDTLHLDDLHVGGLWKPGGSKAGFLAFNRIGANEYLLFIGGRSFAQKEGWFYRYTPGAPNPWALEGTFTGTPISKGTNAWGPQNGAAFVQMGSDKVPYLITFGSKSTERGDVYRTRVRCFTVDGSGSGTSVLTQQPLEDPFAVALESAKLDKAPNQRWGSTAFVDADDRLLVYFTARNAKPNPDDLVHELEIAEIGPP